MVQVQWPLEHLAIRRPLLTWSGLIQRLHSGWLQYMRSLTGIFHSAERSLYVFPRSLET